MLNPHKRVRAPTTHLILPALALPGPLRETGERVRAGAADTQFASFLQIRRRRIGYSIYTPSAVLYGLLLQVLSADLLHFQ